MGLVCFWLSFSLLPLAFLAPLRLRILLVYTLLFLFSHLYMFSLLLVCLSQKKRRINIAFDNRELSAQRMKALFLCNYWSWTNMYMANRPRSLVDFLTWGVSEG